MKEEIEAVLANEELTTDEERVDAITKALGPLVIPKDKYNDLNAKYKAMESSYNSLNTEFDDFKKSKMTDDELRQAEIAKLEADKTANALTTSRLAVKELFLDNEIKISDDDVELKETLENIVSPDLNKSIKLANNYITLLNKTKEITQKETTTNLLNGTPKPDFGNPNAGTASNYDNYKTSYDEAVKNGDFIKQAQFMRLMQEEQMKQLKK